MLDRSMVNRLIALAAIVLCAMLIAAPATVADEDAKWERLTEIQPYGDLEWDMSIKEVLDSIEARWPEAELFLDSTLFPDPHDRVRIGEGLSLFGVFAESQKSMQFADAAEYDVPVCLGFINLTVQGITFLDQQSQFTLSFTSVPALIAAHPERIVYLDTDSGKVAFPMVLSSMQISCSAETAADAAILKDSLEASLTKRYAPYRDVTQHQDSKAAAKEHGGYINGTSRIHSPHQARRFNAQSTWEAWSIDANHSFHCGYTVHQHEDTTTGFSANVSYHQSGADYDFRAEYAEYVAKRRAERNQQLIDISEDL